MEPIVIALIAVGGFAFAGAPEGKGVFEAKCQACHGPKGEGKESIAKLFKVEIPPFSSKAVQSKSDTDLKTIITTGKGKMKPISGLSDKQIEDVIAFVRTLKG